MLRVVVIALERLFVATGSEKAGGASETKLADLKIATSWNHIEAALAYSRGYPLCPGQEGVRPDGLLEKGFDWYVQKQRQTRRGLAEYTALQWRFSQLEGEAIARIRKQARCNYQSDRHDRRAVGRQDQSQPALSLLVALAAAIAGAFALGAKLIGS